MTSPNVVFLTTSGPLGPTFKPSRRRRNPCRTGVTCIEQLAHYPRRWPESDLGSIRRCRAGGKGTAFKPCATTAIESRHRTADPALPRRCLDRRARPSVRGPPDHGHPPPRPGRHRPTAPGPQDDRRLSCPGGRTVRARPVARGRGKRVRSAPTDPGPGTTPSRSTHSTPSGLDQMTASAADVQDPGATPPHAGPCERPQANNYTSNDIPKTGPSNERERCPSHRAVCSNPDESGVARTSSTARNARVLNIVKWRNFSCWPSPLDGHTLDGAGLTTGG